MRQTDHSREAFLEERGCAKGRKRAAVLSVALVGALAVGGTLAFLSTQSGTVENAFTPGSVSCVVEEEFEEGDKVKSDVTVRNTGNVDAYVRAEITVNWVKAASDTLGSEGDVLGVKPVEGDGKDYELTLGSDWKLHSDGFYYYKGEVAGRASTTALIESCQVLGAAPVAGYVLQVDVVASAIQTDGEDAKGNRAVELAWGVDIENGAVIDATISE